MDDKLKIVDINITFNEYFKLDEISKDTQEKLGKVDFLAVPTKYKDDDYYFAQETIDFLKFCRLNSSDYSFDVLADGDIKIRSLHSFDIWMPIIFVSSKILLPIALDIVSNYIKEKMKGREKEAAKVDVTFIVKNGQEEKSLHYSGDAKSFRDTFEKIDLNKM